MFGCAIAALYSGLPLCYRSNLITLAVLSQHSTPGCPYAIAAFQLTEESLAVLSQHFVMVLSQHAIKMLVMVLSQHFLGHGAIAALRNEGLLDDDADLFPARP